MEGGLARVYRSSCNLRTSTLRSCLTSLILLGLGLAVALHLQSIRQALFGEAQPSSQLRAEELKSDDLLVTSIWAIDERNGSQWNVAPGSPLLPLLSHTAIDEERWQSRAAAAARGDQLLLRSLIERVPCPLELVELDEDFKWIQRTADFALDSNGKSLKIHSRDLMRAPIVALGHRTFSRNGLEGPLRDIRPLPPKTIEEKHCSGMTKFGSQVVCIGLFGVETGWLYNVSSEQINCFLNSSEVIALIVNQKHQIDHPKVFSFPLGVRNRRLIGHVRYAVRQLVIVKKYLMYHPSSIHISMYLAIIRSQNPYH